MISNSGMPGCPEADAFREEAIVDAYAEQRMSRVGPSAIKPALKKYGESLIWFVRVQFFVRFEVRRTGQISE